MNKKIFIIIAAVLAVISGLWFFLQPDKQETMPG